MSPRVSRNYLFNLVGPLLPSITAVVTVPLYLHTIGTARYGILTIVWVLLDYFGFLDLGLGQACTNTLSKLGHASSEARARVFVTILYMAAAFGIAATVIFYLAGPFAFRLAFSLPGDLQSELLASFPWIVPMLPAGMALVTLTGALDSRECFLLSNLLKSGAVIACQVFPLLAVLRWGPSLEVLIPALAVVQCSAALVILAAVLWHERPIRSFLPDLAMAQGMFAYGVWVSVNNVIRPLTDTADQMFIARMLGPVAVAFYAVPAKIAGQSQSLAWAAVRTLFPRLSREDVATGQRLTKTVTMVMIYISGAACGPAIILAGPVLELWLGRQFADSSRLVAEILLLGGWMTGLSAQGNSQIQAQGQPHIAARVRATEIIPFFFALWLLIRAAGLPGAALAWLLRAVADLVAMLWLSGSMQGALLRAVPGLALMLACFLLAFTVRPPPGLALGLGILFGLLFLGCGVMLEPALYKAAQAVASTVLRIPHGQIAR